MPERLKDPVSGLTHLFGAFLSVAGLVVLWYFAATRGTPWHIVAFAIFGASLILLYTASAIYHLLPLSDRGSLILRKIDHMMIYILIAGTYTPICLIALRGAWGWSLFGAIWGLAVGGVALNSFWLRSPRWLSTLIYVIMGWLVVVATIPLVRAISWAGAAWLLAGGIFYSVGAVIYAVKRPNIAPGFGFHEIFHLFVLAGSLSHFWLMVRYISRLG
ncbi:MAG: hemolysin III family protein [Firmicutes bacterium]|nr:hemolysin III family protein [Bacillota bacterium]